MTISEMQQIATFETTLQKNQLVWVGRDDLRMDDYRLSKNVLLGELSTGFRNS
jgi:hypothetical protein